MKTLKKKISVLLAILLLLQTPVYASSSNGPSGGYNPGKESIESVDKLNHTVNSTSTQSSNFWQSLNVPLYIQNNDWYCGPASVKMVLQYILGWSNSQSYYASEMGTDQMGWTSFAAIREQLNDFQSWNYEIGVFTTQTQWLEWVKLALRNWKPVIIDINSSGYNWPYYTTGHYMVVSGLNLDYGGATPSSLEINAIVQTVKINDPFDEGEGIKWHPFSRIYGMNRQHKDHAMIY